MFRFFNRRGTVSSSSMSQAAARAAPAYDDDDGGDTALAVADSANAAQRRRVSDRENVLTVGCNISLQGKVRGCAMLYIEGTADVKVKDCGALVVSESGCFNGTAVVGSAEVAGQVNGNLTCTGRLVLRATGRIKGKVRYGALAIETGGDLAGNVAALPATQRDGIGESFFGLERFAKRPSFS
jgi:cytoskeletal protein CcmA (bactofilin family)